MNNINKRKEYLANNEDKPYLIKYNWECGNYSVEDAGEGGLTQDLIIISCITNPDGSYSQNHISINGETELPLTTPEEIKAWLCMGQAISRRGNCPDFMKDIIKDIWNQYSW